MNFPTPAEIKSARLTAGLTQKQAAELAGYSSNVKWCEVEIGTNRMEPVRWLYFLHVSGIQRIPWKSCRKLKPGQP